MYNNKNVRDLTINKYVVKAKSVLTVSFNGARPNYYKITNGGSSDLFLGVNMTPRKDYFDMKIPSASSKLHVEPYGHDSIYIYNPSMEDTNIILTSFEAEYNTTVLALSDSGTDFSTIEINANSVITGFESPLPSGSNVIGKVDLSNDLTNILNSILNKKTDISLKETNDILSDIKNKGFKSIVLTNDDFHNKSTNTHYEVPFEIPEGYYLSDIISLEGSADIKCVTMFADDIEHGNMTQKQYLNVNTLKEIKGFIDMGEFIYQNEPNSYMSLNSHYNGSEFGFILLFKPLIYYYLDKLSNNTTYEIKTLDLSIPYDEIKYISIPKGYFIGSIVSFGGNESDMYYSDGYDDYNTMSGDYKSIPPYVKYIELSNTTIDEDIDLTIYFYPFSMYKGV